MSELSRTEKELVFQYCFGLLSRSEAQQVEMLIKRHPAADTTHHTIRTALAPLACASADCPDELANRTVARLCAAAGQAGAASLSPGRIVPWRWHRDLSHVAAVVTVAACVLLILGTAIPSFKFMRHRYYRQVCLDQLGGIFRSVGLYSSDYDDALPAVARAPGAFWHGIGHQGLEGYSNTRNLYLLLKLGYSRSPGDFVCCGQGTGGVAQLEPAQLDAYHDFPSRDAVTYSYRLMSNPRTKKFSLASQPLLADMNPHFETLPGDLDVCPAGDSLLLNSLNHGRKGQNILWGDGHALFSSQRAVGKQADDIYTLENTSTYRGDEWPTRPDDTFVAP